MHNFKNLNVWQKSIEFVSKIYLGTEQLPSSEIYGLTNQIRRASVSIPSNIAEGASRSSNKDFKRFLRIALGSTFEVETQLLICQNIQDFKFDSSNYIQDLNEIQKMIYKLIKSMKD